MSKIRIPQIVKSLKLPIFTILALIFLLVSVFPVYSKTLEEIEKEISEKKKELETLDESLENAESQVKYSESQKTSTSSELEKVELELAQIDAELEVNKAEAEKLIQELELKNLELEKGNLLISEKLVDLYINDRQGMIDVVLANGQVDGFWKDYKYREALFDVDYNDILILAGEISNLEDEKSSFEQSLAVLESENERLTQQRSDLEVQMKYLSSTIAYNTDLQSGIRAQMGLVQLDIEGLTAEQKKMIEEEMRIIADAHGGTKPLETGEFYFYGRGRAVYQGHGLGFSQYGAMGGALKGMSAHQIATFYYPGSYIGEHVDPAVEDRIKYLGEIPDKACGTQKQANERPDKYAIDRPDTIWDCWPEESIKAQMIVARSYAYTGGTQQVYKSYRGKEWAVNETRGQVLKHKGSTYRDNVIKAFFSADNNNGWGTATHKNPVFCGRFDGNCGPGYSWLQAVNDSSFAAKGPYTDWMWRTNSYTLEELQSMLEWYADAGFVYPRSSDVRDLLNNIGTLQDLQIERDVSGRVARVLVVGSLGSRIVNGDFFKRTFIFWVYNVQPSGEVDPIFSLTYHFRQV